MGAELDVTSNPGTAKALVKGVALIDAVSQRPGELRVTELVELTGMPRPTVIRLLAALCALRILIEEESGRYALGPRLATWGHSFLEGLDLARIGRDQVRRLVEISNETSFLGVLDGDRVLYVAAVNSPQPVRPRAQVGFRNPLHCTAIGKVLMAFARPDVLPDLLTTDLVAMTPATITDRETLRTHLAEVRDLGYAIDDVENEEGVRCVAAPIRDHRGEVVAAISVSAPAYRFSMLDVVELVPQVIAAAAEVSARIGCPPHLAPTLGFDVGTQQIEQKGHTHE